MIRVAIIDDHRFIRSMVARALSDSDEILVVGEFPDAVDVVNRIAAVRPHVVLMDVRMPRISGIDATRKLTASQLATRVVMLTGSIGWRTVADAAQAGAVGFLLKGDGSQALVRAVRAVAYGGTAWPGDLSAATG